MWCRSLLSLFLSLPYLRFLHFLSLVLTLIFLEREVETGDCVGVRERVRDGDDSAKYTLHFMLIGVLLERVENNSFPS